MVADSYLRNIYQVDATTGATAQLLPFGAASSPVALAYDSAAKLLYWSDNSVHTINRYSLRANSSTVIYRDTSDVGKCQCLYVMSSRPTFHNNGISYRLWTGVGRVRGNDRGKSVRE